MKVPFHGLDPRSCAFHYCAGQRGGGGYPAYSGVRYQRGSGTGLGSVLSGLFRQTVPFLKRGLFSLGKYALSSGNKFLEDLEAGKNLNEAAHDRLRAAKNDAIQTITGGQIGSGRKLKKKRKCCPSTVTKRKRTKKQKKRQRTKADFFG